MNSNNGLVLYYHNHSFYCQKVIMALCEKRIPFTTNFIDITKGEQYQPWFLKINPRGEVPVLKDGIKLIPDSVRIIDYLEDNFSNGEHSRLIPSDLSIKQKVIQLRNEIDKLPVNAITMGSFFNSEFCSDLKYPFFIPTVRKYLRAGAEKSSSSLRQHAANNPEIKDTLTKKAECQEEKHKIITEKKEYLKVLDQVNAILEKVESELKLKNGVPWLCCDQFTMADISLTILLDRLSRVGLANYFWTNGKRSNIEKYYQRVQKRDSYRQAVPAVVTDLKYVVQSNAHFMIGLITIMTVVVGSVLYFKRRIVYA
ncbi:UNVERIFIED_CONTAM: hypothetical protein PYX00_007845 [Menopon gallinae]|uniref:Ganglioside-induced differentiation-associated protein 1 n=1 Tax=Menopon gallinae TaxID=328185 RepID=A0AAW2HKU5_9NEOP